MDTLFLSIGCWFCIFPVLILLFFGAVIGIIYRDRRKHTDAWRELAKQARLTFHAPSWFLARPTLTGEWHGRTVRVYTRSTRMSHTGVDSYMFMEMAINLPEGTQFQLLERNILNQLGSDTVKSGDAEFDQRFIIRGQPPEFIHRLFMSGGLQRLLLQAQYLYLEAAGNKIFYRQLNIETNVDYMLFLLSLLFDTADALERS